MSGRKIMQHFSFQLQITMNVLQIIDSASMWPVSVTNPISPRSVAKLESISQHLMVF